MEVQVKDIQREINAKLRTATADELALILRTVNNLLRKEGRPG